MVFGRAVAACQLHPTARTSTYHILPRWSGSPASPSDRSARRRRSTRSSGSHRADGCLDRVCLGAANAIPFGPYPGEGDGRPAFAAHLVSPLFATLVRLIT